MAKNIVRLLNECNIFRARWRRRWLWSISNLGWDAMNQQLVLKISFHISRLKFLRIELNILFRQRLWWLIIYLPLKLLLFWVELLLPDDISKSLEVTTSIKFTVRITLILFLLLIRLLLSFNQIHASITTDLSRIAINLIKCSWWLIIFWRNPVASINFRLKEFTRLFFQ